jgi:anaerobic ribonucleoside-triphosphate reductase
MSDPVSAFLLCLCCEALSVVERGTHEICDVCGWEDDPVQAADHEYGGEANALSLSKAKARWLSCKLQRYANEKLGVRAAPRNGR